MDFPVNLITHNARRGTKEGKAWFIHTADVLFRTVDKDGNVGEAVGEIRLPESAPLTLEKGPHLLKVEPYKNRDGQVSFAIRSIEPVTKKAA